MNTRGRRTDWARILRFWMLLCLSATAGWQGQFLLHDSLLVVWLVLAMGLSVFSIVSLLTLLLLWEPPAQPGKTWRSTAVLLPNLESRLTRRAWTCVLGLVGLGLVFVCILLQKRFGLLLMGLEGFCGGCGMILIWLERIALGNACLVFLLTLGIPHHIRAARMERIRLRIEREQPSPGKQRD